MTQHKLTLDELAFVNQLDALKSAYSTGVEHAKQCFLQRLMRERAAEQPPEAPPAEQPPKE